MGTSRGDGTHPPDGVPVPVPVLIKLSLIDPLRTRCVDGQRVCAKMFREVLRLPAALDLLRGKGDILAFQAWLQGVLEAVRAAGVTLTGPPEP